MRALRELPMRLCALCLMIGLSACTQFPDLDATQTPGVADAPYPRLVPLDPLLAGPEPRATLAVIGAVQGNVSVLKARAARLRAIRPAPDALVERIARLRQKAAALRAAE